jgi:hypothetical protein
MPSSFCTPKEVDLTFTKYAGHEVALPAGQLLVSGPKISFLPRGGQTVYAYEIGDGGNIVDYYLNGKQVLREIWEIEMSKEKGLRNSNFGQKPLQGMQNLTTRVASRFLEVKAPLLPLEVKKPSVPPTKKIAKR